MSGNSVVSLMLIVSAKERLVSHLEKFEELMCSDWAYDMDEEEAGNRPKPSKISRDIVTFSRVSTRAGT